MEENEAAFCPNEEIGEGIILIEEGEYRCRTCNNLIALYRKFNKYIVNIASFRNILFQ
jgi:hypothetical protein